jgi:hypothetical protein
VSTQ